MALFEKREATGNWWKDHSLSLVLVALILVQVTGSLVSGYRVWQAEELPIPFLVWFVHYFADGILTETVGILIIVLLSKWFYERGSAESK